MTQNIAQAWIAIITGGKDDPSLSAALITHNGVDYVLTNGTGEGAFAYLASDVSAWLDRYVAVDGADAYQDFCHASFDPVDDDRGLARAALEEGYRICEGGTCRPIISEAWSAFLADAAERGLEVRIVSGEERIMVSDWTSLYQDGDDIMVAEEGSWNALPKGDTLADVIEAVEAERASNDDA